VPLGVESLLHVVLRTLICDFVRTVQSVLPNARIAVILLIAMSNLFRLTLVWATTPTFVVFESSC